MPVDLIVLAAIAVFVLLRLYGVLGQKMGHDQNTPRDSTFDSNSKVIELTPRELDITPVEEEEADELEEALDDGIKAGIEAIRKDDNGFRVKDFIGGAIAAFEMVLEGFAKDDRDVLKSLLSKEIYSDFVAELKKRKTQDEYVETTLVSVLEAEVKEIELKDRKAMITVTFVSEQIQAERTKDGETVKDSTSSIEQVEDTWTFKRDLRSSNPNWTIITT